MYLSVSYWPLLHGVHLALDILPVICFQSCWSCNFFGLSRVLFLLFLFISGRLFFDFILRFTTRFLFILILFITTLLRSLVTLLRLNHFVLLLRRLLLLKWLMVDSPLCFFRGSNLYLGILFSFLNLLMKWCNAGRVLVFFCYTWCWPE